MDNPRAACWSEDEVKALIAIWGESNIQEELDGATRNKVVFQEIASKMNEKNFSRDWIQCRTKIKNLKKMYREVKDHNSFTGRGRKTCKFYNELDEIIGHRPASVPTVLLDSGSSQQATEESEDISGEQEIGNN